MTQDDELVAAVTARMRAARQALREARAADDFAAVREALDELEEALRVARVNGVDVPRDGASPEAGTENR